MLDVDRLETRAPRGAEQVVDRALRRAAALVARTAAAGAGRLLAAGAVSPGIVLEDRVLLAPNVAGWERLALPRRLRAGFDGTPVAFGTDVKAAALAEARWGSLRGADPAIFLNLGTGVAAGIVSGGHVLAGAHGAAGEIGYALRGRADTAGVRKGRAPLEEIAGGRALGERAGALLGGAWTAADVLAAPDPRARALVAETLDELAVHVANLAIAVDPERIAVGGGLMEHGGLILATLRERLDAAVPVPPELVPAAFVHDGRPPGGGPGRVEAAGVPSPPELARASFVHEGALRGAVAVAWEGGGRDVGAPVREGGA